MQCDDAWGRNLLGFSPTRTICYSGCLISSLAMALNQCNVQLEVRGETVATNPGTLNAWLQLNNGYEDVYGFKWNSTAPIGLVFERFS